MTFNDDDGRMKITVAKDGTDTTAVLDVLAASDRLSELSEVHAAKPSGDFWAAAAGLFSGLGLPDGMSAHTMEALIKAVYARVEELRGKPSAAASGPSA